MNLTRKTAGRRRFFTMKKRSNTSFSGQPPFPDVFPETEKTGDDKYNHRMYYVSTPDFKTFSKTQLFYDQGFNVIDGTLISENNKYILFLKDETRTPPQKNIRIATSKKLTGGYSKPTEPITGNYWAEGPTPVKLMTHGLFISINMWIIKWVPFVQKI
jgi:hypothetical protein